MLSHFKRLTKRHNLPIYKAIPYEVFVRAYKIRTFRNIVRYGFKRKKPEGIVFVIGSYNAGTTIVKNAIGAHPGVSMAPVEGDGLTDELNSFETGGWSRCMMGNCYQIMEERRSGEISPRKFCSDLRPWLKNGKYFLEKSISNTCRIPLLRKAFPGSRFVCVVREPEGVIEGIQKRSSPRDLAVKLLAADHYPEKMLMRQYAYFYGLVLADYQDQQKDIYFCCYEKFIDQPDLEIKRMFDFLKLGSIKIAFEGGVLHIGSRALPIRARKVTTKNRYLDNAERVRSLLQSIQVAL